MEGFIIPLAIIAGLLLTIVGTGFFIKHKITKISREAFGTDSFMEGYKEQKRKLSETPRSVQSMTGIYLPEIHKDFPDFDYDEFKTKAKAVLMGYFNAVSTGTTETLPKEDMTLSLINHILEINEALAANGQKQFFIEPVIHACEIGRYLKDGATVTIRFNIAVGLYSYVEDENGKVINGEKDEKLQTLYEVDLVYLQDADKMGVYGEGLGLNCPNCGAPIKNLGQKFCLYCGTGVVEVNTRVWKFNAVREQTKRRTAY